MATFNKDPNAVLDYTLDWGSDAVPEAERWLPEGDTIETSTWTVPTGITKDSDSHDDKTTTVWLSGGTAGDNYELVNRVTTAAGRTDDRTIIFYVRER